MVPVPPLLTRAVSGGARLAAPPVRATINRVFGPPPFDPDRDPGDPGLFGPGSATWPVIGDLAAIVGGLRALLVQLLHPLAMAGVADHSDFRDDPLDRLQRTSDYVVGTAFGSTAEAFRYVRRVRGVHTRIVGTAPDGRPYRADDPHLLTWISLALTSSFLAADRAYAGRPVDTDVADRFVAEQSRLAALLDPRVDLDELTEDPAAVDAFRAGRYPLPMLTEGRLPEDVAALHARLDDYRPELRLTEQSRRARWFLLWPQLPATIRPWYLPMLGGAVATLDDDQRRTLRLPLPAPARRATRAEVRALIGVARGVIGASPSRDAAGARAMDDRRPADRPAVPPA